MRRATGAARAQVGCALSTLMGWHNHDCNPNAGATIADCGRVRIESKRRIALGEEARGQLHAVSSPPYS